MTAAVDAAGVAWLAQRFAERELFAAGEKQRAAVMRQLSVSNRQVQEAIKLVMVARATAEAAEKRAAADNKVAGGPRLFDGTAG